MNTTGFGSKNQQDVLSAIDELGKSFTDLGMTHDESALAVATFIVNHYDNRHGYGASRRIPVPIRLRENADKIADTVKPFDIEIGAYEIKWNVIESKNSWVDLMNKFRKDGTITMPLER